MYLILGAMEGEIEGVREKINGQSIMKAGNGEVLKGRIGEVPAAVACCGVGKVNSSAAAQRLIDFLKPEALIMVGIAGAVNPEYKVKDLLICADSLQHDIDVTALKLAPGKLSGDQNIFTPGEGSLISAAGDGANLVASASGVRSYIGRIATGDQFIQDPEKRSWIRDTFQADAVDMETGAVARVAEINGIPFVSIRVISDTAGHVLPKNFREFLKEAAGILGDIIVEMITILP